ncbi:MAG: CBS domain-containing protein [Deltaproteobacteria bacterium]|nr:MAG: CBS domain-containing protein [Deltaproteobacteria bacterium]
MGDEVYMKNNKLLATPLKNLDLPKQLLTAKQGMSLRNVHNMMCDCHVGSVLILAEDGSAAGIITERDFLFKIAGKGIDFDSTLVDDYMTSHPTTVEHTATLQQAMQCMNLGGFRHVIIVDEKNKVKTLISIKDVLNFLYEFMSTADDGSQAHELIESLELPPLPVEVK